VCVHPELVLWAPFNASLTFRLYPDITYLSGVAIHEMNVCVTFSANFSQSVTAKPNSSKTANMFFTVTTLSIYCESHCQIDL